eukprot:7513497-Pyramimonas_sp.AAC.1
MSTFAVSTSIVNFVDAYFDGHVQIASKGCPENSAVVLEASQNHILKWLSRMSVSNGTTLRTDDGFKIAQHGS